MVSLEEKNVEVRKRNRVDSVAQMFATLPAILIF